MQRYIDNRPEIGDTLTLRPLIKQLLKYRPNDKIVVRSDPHHLLGDLDVEYADRCCAICGSEEFESVVSTPYSRCIVCGFWYQYPVPTPRYENPVNENKGHLMSDHDKAVNAALAESLYLSCRPKSVLDIGSKYPYLLHCMKKFGAEVQGIDGCEKALEYGEQLDVPMVKDNFLHYETKQQFDLITMVHLIEHFEDPRLAIRHAKTLLKKNGTLFIRTPCTDGDVSSDMTPGHFTIHPVLFNKKSLQLLLEQEGFEIAHTREAEGVGQVDVHAIYREDKRFDPILRQWTYKHPHGDFLRRYEHFYRFPLALAEEIQWLPRVVDYAEPDMPPLPNIDDLDLPAEFIAIAHESGGAARRWPIERWRRVAEWFSRTDKVVVLGKTPLGAQGTVDYSGKLSVLQSAAVIRRAAVLVSADTMAAHVSSLAGVPTVVLMGPAEVTLTYPTHVKGVYRHDGGCTRCYHALRSGYPYIEGHQLPIHHSCNPAASTCMDNITVAQVIDAVLDTLECPVKYDGLISVCMVVRNEEHNVEPALRSIMDLADEVVVVDTGSTDRTKEVVSRVLANKRHKLLDYNPGDPIRSFSEMRNFAFKQATSRYVMWLDAGDRLSDATTLRQIVMARAYDSYSLQTVYGTAYWRERIVLREFAEFQDDVHETMRIDGLSSTRVKGVVVNHIWSEKRGREPSLERNVRMLKTMIEREGPAHPRYARWVYYLARDLMQLGKRDEALVQFKRCVTLSGFWEERMLAAVYIAKMHVEARHYREAIIAAIDALKICDRWRDPYYIIGDANFWLGNYELAIGWFEHCLKIERPAATLGVWEDLYAWLPQCQLSYCCEKLGRRDDALRWAQEEVKCAPTGQLPRINARIKEFSGA